MWAFSDNYIETFPFLIINIIQILFFDFTSKIHQSPLLVDLIFYTLKTSFYIIEIWKLLCVKDTIVNISWFYRFIKLLIKRNTQ